MRTLKFLPLLFILFIGMISCSNDRSAVISQLKSEAENLNAQCPYMVDESTRMDKVEADGLTLKYSATIFGITAEEYRDIVPDESILKNLMIETLKNDPNYYAVKALGATYAYEYYDESGDLIYYIEITPDDM